MLNIGALYFNGEGGSQNGAEAHNWYARGEACAGKNQESLGQLFHAG